MRRSTVILLVVASLLVIVASIYNGIARPYSVAEAQAALASIDASYNGERILQSQFGEEDPRRLPLHTWMLSSFGLASGRLLSLFLLLIAAIGIGLVFKGRSMLRILAAFACALVAFQFAVPASPAVPLAMLLTLAMAALEIGRSQRLLTTGWWLAPLLGAAASLVWAPALLLVLIPWCIEWLAAFKRGERALPWSWVGPLLAAVVIGLWQIPFSRLSTAPLGWLQRQLLELTPTAPLNVSGRLLPLLLLVILSLLPRSPGRLLAILCAVAALWRGEPLFAAPALFLIGARLGDDESIPALRQHAVRLCVLGIALLTFVMMPAQAPPQAVPSVNLPTQATLVVDRRVDPRLAWSLAQAQQKPPRRHASPGAAWALTTDRLREVDALGWSLMATPLTAPALPTDTLAEFEAKLQAARVAARENVDRSDPLPEIWVGRRLAYLGRFDEAIEHYSTLLERHPQESRILRHRGHRYISLRQLDAAIADLTRAAELERGRADRVEPDGLPNAFGVPRSSTQNNIYYHLGLAYYLRGELDEALTSFERCRELSANDDMLVATAHWLHMIQRRLGRDEANAALCRALDRPLEILENDGYQTLLELYCGSVEWDDSALDLSNDAIAYGVARWLRDRDAPEAERLYRQILDRAPSYSFGAIAAEADVARELIGRQRVAW